MNINTNYVNYRYGSYRNVLSTGSSTADSIISDLFSKAQNGVENKEEVKSITAEQINHLKSKYNLSDLKFYANSPADEATARIMGENKAPEFLHEILEMGLITQEEYIECMTPISYATKPSNYDSLSPEEKATFVLDPYVEVSNPTALSTFLTAETEGMNLLDAFRVMAVKSQRSADLSLGLTSRQEFSQQASMYSRLSGLLGQIFE